MLLILTASDDATADYLCGRLGNADVPFIRVNTDTSLEDLAVFYDSDGPRLRIRSREFEPADIDHVWYRRPSVLQPPGQLEGIARVHATAEWAEALEGFLGHIPLGRWMNHPANNTLAAHKLEQLTRAAAVGFSVPKSLVTQDPGEARRFWDGCRGKMVVKSLSGGYLPPEDGKSGAPTLIYANSVTEDDLDHLPDVRWCPTFFQQLVRKQLEVRLTVVDDALIPIGMQLVQRAKNPSIDIRQDEMRDVLYCAVDMPGAIAEKTLDLMHSYHLRFGAIDLAVTPEGEWVFFELNPNGQWAWLDQEAGADIASAFIESFHRPA